MQEIRRFEKEVGSMLQAARSMARRYGRVGIAEPDDIVQTAMLELLNKKDGRKANLGWMFKVVKSSAMDAGRQAKRERRVMFYDRQYTGLAGGSCLVHEPEQEIDSEMDLEIYLLPRLKDLFSRLSKPHAEAMVLYLEGHSYDEIAALTGMRKGTVRSRLHYARRQARSILSDLAQGELA